MIDSIKPLEFTLRSMARGKDYNDTIMYSCDLPRRHVSVDFEGNCFLCNCEAWLPVPVGKITDFDSLESIWNSPVAKILQDDIDQKKYTWCAVTHCGVTKHNKQQTHYSLSINIDNSCNLACPSCRREMFMLEDGPEFDLKKDYIKRILTWLEKFDKDILISLGGSGDAIASPILRELVLNYKPKSNQYFTLGTNGLLLKKIMPKTNLPVYAYYISIDAASKDVYEQVRRPGKWENLIENLEWIAENRGTSEVRISFVVQQANYKDLPAFIELGKRLDVKCDIQPLSDWTTWDSYFEHNVADPDHPEHQHFVDIVRQISYNKSNTVHVSPFFDKFL